MIFENKRQQIEAKSDREDKQKGLRVFSKSLKIVGVLRGI